MHLTPNQRLAVVNIYFRFAYRSQNRAKITSEIAARQHIFISEREVKKIIAKWDTHSKFKL